jgi:hypothetical protein
LTLIQELIELPDRVHRGDFVLRLTEGIERPEETLRQYVVTEQLAACFDGALAFIRSALDDQSSKASYLHGSFGSGKSHFMAVLNLLLRHHAGARSVRELAPVIAKHESWITGKRFLLVPYHMIGARSMESALLGHYAEHVRKLHPDAPIPGVYQAERLFTNADGLRASLGDEAFFSGLNEAEGGGSSGWGELAAAWTPESYAEAAYAPPGSEPRARLVGALIARYFSAYQGLAGGHEEAFVPLDEGLSIVSRHAKELGYDAVVLFLDELILWLASHAADAGFVNREGQKLAKLVEAQSAERPIPLVSFVARQRDLRELVGEHVPGAQQLGFGDVLRWWEARFHTITLEDRNLPAIAEKRVLRPRSEAARQELDQAFRETAQVRDEVMNTLLTSTADREMFRQVYPFSPALIQVLVAVSSLLQRERTALKVMVQLLVSQRDRLRLGDVVPVGDLYDVIAEGDEAFTDEMRRNFDNAQRLYQHKILPLLEQQYGVRADALGSADEAGVTAFRADGRLVKTLLLAALAPEVEALRALTPGRLAALNHGTIRAPIAGREAQIVLTKCKQWAAQVGELRVGEEPGNPTIQIQLSGVDTESILERARANDTFANRLRRVRELLFAQLGLPDQDELFVIHELTWRGTRRRVEVVFTNVRELPDDSLASASDWRVIIDYPFDEAGHTPADDLARVQRFEQSHASARTLVWLPAFFTGQTLKELGTYATLDHVLRGERFEEYASHLSAVDRAAARSLLENQRSQLKQRLIHCLDAAYGITETLAGSIDRGPFEGPSDQFLSLDPTFRPQTPVGANLGQALQQLLDQAFAHQFPAHPAFESEMKPALLRKVLEEVRRAAQTPDGRVLVERPLRAQVRHVANPLELGVMHETHLLLSSRWKDHFGRRIAEEQVGHPTVAQLRRWIDQPRPMGLPREVQNLVILLYADQTNRSFFRHGGPIEPSLDGLPDDLELREQALPRQETWDVAVARAAALFGVVASPLRNASNLARLTDGVRQQAMDAQGAVEKLLAELRARGAPFGLSEDTDRLRSIAAGERLLAELRPEAADVVATLVRFDAPTSDQAVGKALKSASEVHGSLESTLWDLFEAVAALKDVRAKAAAAIGQRVREALEHDELAMALAPALAAAQRDALKLIKDEPKAPPPPPAPSGFTVVEAGEDDAMTARQAREQTTRLLERLEDEPALRLRLQWALLREKSGR